MRAVSIVELLAPQRPDEHRLGEQGRSHLDAADRTSSGCGSTPSVRERPTARVRPGTAPDGARRLQTKSAVGDVDERVKRHEPGPSPIGNFESGKVSLAEGELGIEAPAHGQHGRGQVDSDHVDPLIGEITRDVTRSAPQIAHCAPPRQPSSKAVEQLTVEGLAAQFVGERRCIAIGDRVVIGSVAGPAAVFDRGPL